MPKWMVEINEDLSDLFPTPADQTAAVREAILDGIPIPDDSHVTVNLVEEG